MNIPPKIKKPLIALLDKMRLMREKIGYAKRCFVTPEIPKNKDGKMYVNLGCGVNTSEEFINVDTRPFPHTHYIHEVEKLPMFETDSVDLLYAAHILEHIDRSKLMKTLKEWRRVLKQGGILRIGVPDFDGLLAIYHDTGKNVEEIMAPLMGGEGEYDDHHTVWNFEYAEKLLKDAGYKEVRKWDPAKVKHHDFTDKTTRTYKTKKGEIPISLNVEAVK